MPGEPTHYQRLGVPADASVAVIRQAFRALVKTAHPDAGGDPEAFRALREAHDTLCDPRERRAYDERVGIHRQTWRDPGAEAGGWSGPQGAFTGDVDFPSYLRDVADAPWAASAAADPVDAPGTAAPTAPLPAEVGWWWPHAATRPPVAAGPVVVLTSGRVVAGCSVDGGHEAWRAELAGRVVAGPVVVGHRVVVADEAGGVSSLDIGSGQVTWYRRGPEAAAALVGIGDRGLVVAAGRVVAWLDAGDGAPGWRSRLAGPAVLAVAAGEAVVLATSRQTLEGLDLGRGRHRFSLPDVPTPTEPPVWAGDRLWLLAGSGRIVGLDVSVGAADVAVTAGLAVAGLAGVGEALYATTGGPSQVVALDPRGSIRWTLPLPAVALTPAIDGPDLHVVGADDVLRRVDAATGAVRRQASLATSAAAPPVAAAGGRVLVPDRSGTIWCLLPAVDRR